MQNDPSTQYDGVIPEMRSIQSAIVAPLILNDTVLGALSLESSRPNAFTEEDKSLFVTFAATATAAYRNALLHREVQKLARTDALTSVYNRTGFFEMGRREVERARRFKHPLSVIMLDVDLFKDINDTFGHENGDQVLRVIAERISASIREIDIFGRYGGDEFIILLPESDLQNASTVAERLRNCIESTPIQVGKDQIPVTISLGVAMATEKTSSLAELIDQADAAMYQAKQSGRNRVAV
jgi:diguanylate cyclase (GGDEF)-like protein